MISSGKLKKKQKTASLISAKHFHFFFSWGVGVIIPCCLSDWSRVRRDYNLYTHFFKVESPAEVENGHKNETKGTLVRLEALWGWGLWGLRGGTGARAWSTDHEAKSSLTPCARHRRKMGGAVLV